MKNVLVIYEMIPESSHMHLIEADEETVEILKLCHRHYVNNNDDTEEISLALNKLSLMLGDRSDDNLQWAAIMGIPHELVGLYRNSDILNEEPVYPIKNIDMVIHTGWVM